MISYLIFQDSLKPKLTSIFDTSLSKAENSLNYNKQITDLEVSLRKSGALYSKVDISKPFVFSEELVKDATNGLMVSSASIKGGNWYKLSYDLKVLDGSVQNLGGHINSFNNPKYDQLSRNFKVNGENKHGSHYYSQGILLDNSKNYKVSLEFFAEADGLDAGEKSSKGVWIQPNRGVTQGGYIVEISNIAIFTI